MILHNLQYTWRVACVLFFTINSLTKIALHVIHFTVLFMYNKYMYVPNAGFSLEWKHEEKPLLIVLSSGFFLPSHETITALVTFCACASRPWKWKDCCASFSSFD